ncbi:cytochrome C oxidase subunit II [Paenibacillus sp. GCM10023252]|uniref:cytochrome C oxidase subunit II n=1 Tax=Paenibacillus sp. GCM10023252 TaxID=3252649 RepID=UPI00361F1850
MRKWMIFAAVLTLVLVIAACGGTKENDNQTTVPEDNNGGTTAGTTAGELVVKAANWKFDEAEYRIKKGEAVNLSLESTEGIHGIAVRGTDIEVANGKTETVTINDAGEYELYCTVPCGTGHSKMKAKLIVE